MSIEAALDRGHLFAVHHLAQGGNPAGREIRIIGGSLDLEAGSVRHQQGHIVTREFLHRVGKRLFERSAELHGTHMLFTCFPWCGIHHRNHGAHRQAGPAHLDGADRLQCPVDVHHGLPETGEIVAEFFGFLQAEEGRGRRQMEMEHIEVHGVFELREQGHAQGEQGRPVTLGQVPGGGRHVGHGLGQQQEFLFCLVQLIGYPGGEFLCLLLSVLPCSAHGVAILENHGNHDQYPDQGSHPEQQLGLHALGQNFFQVSFHGLSPCGWCLDLPGWCAELWLVLRLKGAGPGRQPVLRGVSKRLTWRIFPP